MKKLEKAWFFFGFADLNLASPLRGSPKCACFLKILSSKEIVCPQVCQQLSSQLLCQS
jgi:hypothetical protein